MGKVYSYIRFSTPEQADGDSCQRQEENIRRYCETTGHVFDADLTIRDFGKSAYTKAHLDSGRLGVFLKAVEDGKVKRGSVLFVEDFDRLSRADLFTSMGILKDLLYAGITVYADKREYTQALVEKDESVLFAPILTFMRGHQESARKGVMLRAVWRHKRETGLPLTRQMPAWCKLDGNRIVADDAKAAVVRRIFRMGRTMGPKRIARIFNAERLPMMLYRKRKTAGWQPSYISKILTNPAVMGHFQPHITRGNKRVPEGELRDNYYPRVIAPAEFHSVRQKMRSRRHKGGRIGTTGRNLFTHLAYAGDKDAPMHFVSKGKDPSKGGQYLVSDTSIRNYGQAWWAWRYSHFEQAFIRWALGVDFSKLILPTKERLAVQAELRETDGALAAASAKLDRLLQLVEDDEDDFAELRQRIDRQRKEADQLRGRRNDLQGTLFVTAKGSVPLQSNQGELRAVLARLATPAGRNETRAVLKDFIYRLSLWPFGLGQWRRPKRSERNASLATLPCFEVQFQQTNMRQLVVVHPDDPTVLFWSEYYDETTNTNKVFKNNTKAILAMMFPETKRGAKPRRRKS